MDLSDFVKETIGEMDDAKKAKPKKPPNNSSARTKVVPIAKEEPRVPKANGARAKKDRVDELSDDSEADELLYPKKTTARFTETNMKRLRRAALLQKLNEKQPDTVQGILNEAFEDWWKQSGYE